MLVPLLLNLSGATQHSVTAAQGSYTLTGQAVGLTASRTLTMAQGSYVLTGQQAVFIVPRTIMVDQGSYALTGQAANLTSSNPPGSYALSGQNVTLTHLSVGGPIEDIIRPGTSQAPKKKRKKKRKDEEVLVAPPSPEIVEKFVLAIRNSDTTAALEVAGMKLAAEMRARRQRELEDEEALLLLGAFD